MSVIDLETIYPEDFEDDEDFAEDFDDDEAFAEDDELESVLADAFDDDDEAFEEDFDDEDFDDDESFAERRRRRRRRFPKFRRRRARFRTRARPRFRRARGKRAAKVRTRSGRMTTVRLGRSFATARDVNAFKVETKKAIMNARKETKDNFTKLDVRLNKFTKTLDKKINVLDVDLRKTRGRVAKVENTSRMSTMLPLLMGNPEVKSIRFAEAPTAANKPFEASVEYKDDNSMLLPLVLMSGSGGSGDNTALLALALAR